MTQAIQERDRESIMAALRAWPLCTVQVLFSSAHTRKELCVRNSWIVRLRHDRDEQLPVDGTGAFDHSDSQCFFTAREEVINRPDRGLACFRDLAERCSVVLLTSEEFVRRNDDAISGINHPNSLKRSF